jgi:hypothetical protein
MPSSFEQRRLPASRRGDGEGEDDGEVEGDDDGEGGGRRVADAPCSIGRKDLVQSLAPALALASLHARLHTVWQFAGGRGD